MSRVAFLGLDGVEPTLVETMLAAGEMPRLAALRSRGLWCPLEDRGDFRTGLVWEHLLLGKGAERSRRWSGVEFDPAGYETRQVGAGHGRPFYACDPPLRCVVFDVPYVHPAFRVPGVVVTAWGGHDSGYPRASEPPGLLTEIDGRFGHHRAFENDHVVVWNRPEDVDRIADALVEGSAKRAQVIPWLLEKTPGWDLLLTVLSEPHSAGEHFWHGVDPLNLLAHVPSARRAGERLHEVYRAVDEAVGRIADALPGDACLVVASIHGMCTNHPDLPSMVLLPELLHRRETGRPLLRDEVNVASWRARGCPPLLLGPKDRWMRHLTSLRSAPGGLAGVRRWLARRGTRLLRPFVRRPAKPEGLPGALGVPIPQETSRTPEEIGRPRLPIGWHPCNWYRASWPKMRAFAVPTFYDGRIRLNLEGRESAGIVPRGDYGRVLDDLEAWLAGLRDVRTGRPAVEEVRRAREADPFVPGDPESDLVVTWALQCDAIEDPETGVVGPHPFRRTGGHTPDGFLSVTGAGIARREMAVRPARDLTPTLLALLGRPVPPDMEGTPVPEALPAPALH